MTALELETATARAGIVSTRPHLLLGQGDEVLRGKYLAARVLVQLDLEVVEDEADRIVEDPERSKQCPIEHVRAGPDSNREAAALRDFRVGVEASRGNVESLVVFSVRDVVEEVKRLPSGLVFPVLLDSFNAIVEI
jgi:hypothetical protein